MSSAATMSATPAKRTIGQGERSGSLERCSRVVLRVRRGFGLVGRGQPAVRRERVDLLGGFGGRAVTGRAVATLRVAGRCGGD